LIAIFPGEINSEKTIEKKIHHYHQNNVLLYITNQNDSVKRTKTDSKEEKDSIKKQYAVVDEEYFSYKSVRELDSIQKRT
jgi:hypothetical protein